MLMNYLFRRILIISGVSFLAVSLSGQNYQEEMKLMRPKPGHLLLYGQIVYPSQQIVKGAHVSLFNPMEFKVEERIPIDDFGAFLFSIQKGRTYGLIVEHDGYFPYYTSVQIPSDYIESAFQKNLTLGEHLKRRMELVFQPFDTLLTASSQLRFSHLVDLLHEQRGLLVWFHPTGDSFDPIRINMLSSLLVGNGVEAHRLMAGPSPTEIEHILELFISTTATSAEPGGIEGTLPGNEEWTIQFMASRRRVDRSEFKGLDPVYEFQGKDGYYRYCYGHFSSNEKANSALNVVKAKGFKEAFSKSVGTLKKL